MTERFAARRVAIIGLGLIGGSLARALRAGADVEDIAGCVRKDSDVPLALELGLVDSVTTDVAEAVAGADVVVLAVSVSAMQPVLAQVAPALGSETIVTDVGSTKASVVAAARAALGESALARFVPGHPIAGTEHSGLRASVDGLFSDRRTILTPAAEADPAAVARIEHMWQAVGARVTMMTAAHHDEVLAATSHLPHVLAFALVDTLAAMEDRCEIFDYAAGGFADFSRIASSDPALWRSIVFANREAVLPALSAYIDKLEGLRQALQDHDEAAVTACFSRAKQARDRFAALRGPSRNK